MVLASANNPYIAASSWSTNDQDPASSRKRFILNPTFIYAQRCYVGAKDTNRCLEPTITYVHREARCQGHKQTPGAGNVKSPRI